MSHESEYDTTVLSDEYSDYHETVVDQGTAFDPSLFQGSQGAMAQQAQQPTWVSAGSGYAGGASSNAAANQPAPTTRPTPQPQQPAPQPVWSQPQQQPAPQPVWSKPQSAAQQAGPSAVNAPAGYNPEEDTWVLGAPGTSHGPVYAPSATAETMAAAPNYAAAPAYVQPPSASWQTAPRTTRTMMQAADSKPNKISPLIIGVIIGLAIVGAIAIVVALVLAFGPQQNSKPESSTPAAVVAPASSSSAASSSAASEAAAGNDSSASSEASKSNGAVNTSGPKDSTTINGGTQGEASEVEFYESLMKLYNQIGEYDNSIRSCASEFNNNYMSEDMSLRSGKASTASSVKSRIKSSWDSLERLKPPLKSVNAQTYLDMCELYECLWHRIDVIDRAWQISLKYDKPKDHESEILAPILDQQEGGNDKYYTRFNNLYPNVHPIKP